MLKNGFYNIVGAGIRLIFNLLSVPLLIRILGVEEYGLWALISAVIGLVALAEAGLAVSTTIFVARDLGINDQTGVSETLTITGGAILIFATIAAGLLWLLAPYSVQLFPRLTQVQSDAVIPALQFAGLVVWTRLIQQVLVGVEQAYQRYDILNILYTLQIVVLNIGLACVAWYGGRIVALMLWQVYVSLVILIAHLYACWWLLRRLNLRLQWSLQKGREVGRYSIMTWLTALGGTFFVQGDRLIVGIVLGSTALGLYAAITNITSQINTFSALAVQPLVPALSMRMAHEGETPSPSQSLQLQLKQALQTNGVIALVLGSILFSFAVPILNVMMPESVSDGTVVLFRLAIVIYTFYSLNAVGYFVLFAVKDVKTLMLVQVFSGLISLSVIYISALYFGTIGAIIGNATYNLTLLLNYYALRRLKINFYDWFISIGFPVLWFAVVVILSVYTQGIGVVGGALLFLLELLALGVWYARENRDVFWYMMRRFTNQYNVK